MKIKPKSAKRVVELLTDPTPTHLSSVDHGANQAPWKTIKSHTGKGNTDMTLKTQGSKEPVVRALTLSKTQFKTEESAIKYLASKQWDQDTYELWDDEDVWIAKSTEVFAKGSISKTRSVATKDAGVFMQVAEVLKTQGTIGEDEPEAEEEDLPESPEKLQGPLVIPTDANDNPNGAAAAIVHDPAAGVARAAKPSPATDDEDFNEDEDKPTMKLAKVRRVVLPKPGAAIDNISKAEKKTPVLAFRGDLAKKYDWFGAYLSDDTTLAGVIKDGMSYDDLPPGIDCVMDAIYCTASNILGDSSVTDKKSALNQLGTDFANITLGMYELFTKSGGLMDDESAQKFHTSFKASIQVASKKSLIATDIVAKEVKTEATDDTASIVKSAVESALGSVTASIDVLKGQLKGVTDQVTSISQTTPRKKSLSGAFDDMHVEPSRKDDGEESSSISVARSLLGGRRPSETVARRH